MAVFWVVAPCSLVEFSHVTGILAASIITTRHPDDGGNKHLHNVSKLLPDYTVQPPRKQPSSYSPPWELKICLYRNRARDVRFGYEYFSAFNVCVLYA
jgi:hypothetical protein